MIVKNVHLENWAIFREPIEVEFSDGLNILHGPNDIGKTTLIDSIRTVFFTKHTSHSEKVRSLIPWGSALSPKATITFFQNGAYYRITKRFIASEMSLLEKLTGKKWTQIAEGDNADKKVIELVGGKLAARGDTRPEFWGIGQALWIVQGEPFISEDLNEETLSSLQKLIGAAIETSQERNMFKMLNERFCAIFTGVRREFKKSSDIKNIQEQIAKLEHSKGRAERDRLEKEELIRTIEDKEVILQRKEQKLRIALKEKEKLKKRVDEAHKHKRNREKLEEEIRRISSEHKALKDQIDRIKEGRRKIRDIEAKNKLLNREKSQHQKRLKELQQEIDKLARNISDLKEDLESKDESLQCARIAHDAIQKERELREKEDLLKQLEELENDLLEKQRSYESLKAPSQKEIDYIEGIHQQIRDINTKLDAIGLTTKIIANSSISGKIQLDQKSETFSLERGEGRKWTSHQMVQIKVDTVGIFEIRSGSEDVRDMRDKLEKLQIDYEKLVAPYGTDDIKKLRELSQKKVEKERDIKRLKKELKKQAKEGKEAILRQVAGLKGEVIYRWQKIPGDCEFRKYMTYRDKTSAQKELGGKIDEFEKTLKNLKKEQKELDKRHSKLVDEREKIKSEIQRLDKKIHGNSERMEEIRTILAKLQEDGFSLQEREKRLDQKSVELDKKQRALKEYNSEIHEVEEKPLEAWNECETTIERLQKDTDELKRDIAEMNGRLSEILRGLKDMNRIEEELDYLKTKETQLLIDARAVELVYDLMHFYRGKTIESLTSPIQKIMRGYLRGLFGERYTDLKFDERVKPVSVGVTTWGVDAPIDVLSFGTKEQMWYLFRLALGRLLSTKERQLVVLDDPLANTDPGRMHRALQILKDSADDLQIVVITCDVDKYNWLPDANFISLEK